MPTAPSRLLYSFASIQRDHRHAGLPKPVVDKLGGALAQVLQMPDIRERLVGMALDVATPGPDEMKRRWKRIGPGGPGSRRN